MTPAPGSGAHNAGRSPIKQALGAIDRLQARLDAAESARTEPIAIVGVSCRFPGSVNSPDSYWRLLANGVDAVTEVPRERWDLNRYYDPNPDAPGKMYTRHGGFLDDVAAFDSWFFRISPREAASMDPQQRLLLEVAWEAIEDAGIAADALGGTATGVFVGLTTNDYAQLLMREGAGQLDAFFFTGNPANAAAGRLAYAFGFQGPALAIDTACSSSLVAVHQACASLRAGECRTALAGGVNLVLAPETTIAVCRTRALSPAGRCKTFDRDADGFVRSEGCGLVVLKRLSDALADGSPIRAVIRGSAVNQDGASSGFTVPNGPAQQAVIRTALGGIAPGEIDYLEAHGTGTPLGDPIEVAAAAAVLGAGRDAAHPLYIGSVKSNIGHAEAAAGIAALIKAVLALEHSEIPPHLHCDTPNPLIPWDTLPVRVPRERTPWPSAARPRRAGVSAFGASGTNAHLVVESAPDAAPSRAGADQTHHLLVLSAKQPDSLSRLAAAYRERLAAASPAELGDICYSAATGRVHHRHRVALVAATAAEAVAGLDAAIARIDESAAAKSDQPAARVSDEDAREYAELAARAPSAADADTQRSLLDRLGALFVAGVDPDWAVFNPSFPRRRVALPTYPFQRTHHWFTTKDDRMQNAVGSTSSAGAAPPRRDAVLAVLRKYIAELLQAPEAEINIHLPFLEMGADSLVMVDAIGLVEKEFGLKLAIRRFFEDLSTIDALAGFIDSAMPPDAPAATAPAAAAGTAPVAAFAHAIPDAALGAAGSTPFERILVEQTRFMAQFMAQQAEIMRMALGGTATPGQLPAFAPAPAAPASKLAAPAARIDAPVAPPMPWGNPAEIRARGLTSEQHAHLEALIARYTARTAKSKARTQQYRTVLADSRATVGFRLSTKEMLYPIWGARTDGSRTWDIDDNEYIDFTMGFGVHLFGHKPAFVQDALREDVERAVELGARSDLAGEVAELFTELTGLDRVAFSNSGTEAVMAAVRLARAKTGRDKIAIFTNAYHGHADTTLARAQNTGGVLASVPMAPGVPGSIAADIIVLDYGSDEALDIIRRRGHEIGAVMVEPVQSRHLKQQPRAFLHALRALTTEIGAALIFDEMITGFRAHLGGAQAYFGVKADLATYGKIVGGGMPIGLVAGSAEFMDGVDGGMWQYGDGSFPAADRTAFGGTFCQHPLSMAAARATLRHLKAQGPGLQLQLNDRTDALMRRLNDYFTAEAVPIEATNFSSLFRFEFSSNLDLLFYHMLEKGIYIWEWRSCFLSTAHSDADVDRFVDVVKESIADLRRGGFAPRSISGSSSPSGAGPVHIIRTGTGDTTPLTEAQRQLWLLTEIDDTSSIAYNVSTTLELQGPLDCDRLRAALQHVVDRHSALRTTITSDGSGQIVHPSSPVTLPVTDVSCDQEADRESALARWRDAASRAPLDLVNGPVFRPQLVQVADDRHVLMLTAHHILADGMTMGVILQDLTAFYNNAESAAARPQPMQFGEYVALRNAQRGSAEMQAHEAFWIAQFADGVPQLDLPLDRVRPRVKTYTGGRVTTEIDPVTVEALKRVSRQHGCTLNMSLLTIFALLLHRFSGQDDVIVGTSVTGRPFRGSMEMAGYCTHLVPVRSRLAGDPAFADLLKTTKGRLLDVLDHQDLPFAELLHTLPIPRSTGTFPLISAVFNLEPVSTLPAFEGLTTRLLPQAVSFTPFDLFVNVTEGGATLLVDTDFNADLFDAATVARMMGCFDTLIRAIVENPAASARRLPLLSPADRIRQFVEWNRTARPYPADAFVHSYFEQRAAEHPGRVAVEFEQSQLTYAELNARANQLSSWLESRGVGPDVLVGICCERSLELMVAVMAVLKAGGAYVPIDPDYPDERVAFMLSDANPPVVLTEARWADRLKRFEGDVFRLDADWPLVADMDASNPGHAVTREQLAYMIYTSGSTGQPKGALNTHAGIANRLLWMQETYGLTAEDRVLQKTPFSFDVSVWELLWPLMTGARLIMASPGGHRDPRYLVDLIERAGITTIHFVPSMLSAFLEEPDLSRCRSLKRIICSGEALSPELLRRCVAALDAPVHNLYGPTEAAVDVTSWACDVGQAGANVPIGKPIANTQIYLLDARRQPVPIGVTGELYIGGIGVGRGYWNRPELTRERFLSDPFTRGTGRLYRTGDLARFRPDGNIEFLGRIDGQVKVRGFRIELGEIETRLLAYPGVTGAVVVAENTAAGDKRLVAYIAIEDRPAGLPSSVTEHLSRALPDYMVPSAVIALGEIPLLPNGKIDRSRLPAVQGANTHVPPAAGRESEIAAIWEDVLRQSPIGATDDFFALGGNSLSAAQVVSRIARRVGSAVGIKDLFSNPTVRALAAALTPGMGDALPPIARAAAQPDYPLSHAQRRFWIQDRLGDSRTGNSHPASFLIEGPLDAGALRRAFGALIARHEILRTVFVDVHGQARQKVVAPGEIGFDLAVTTLTGADADLDSAVRDAETRHASTRMDLTTGPLLRAELITANGDRHVCVCSMHHAITDGWSVGVLLNNLTALYDAFVSGRSDPLAPLPIQYKDYAAWETQLTAAPEFDTLRAYWQAQFNESVADLGLYADLAGAPGAFTRATRQIVIDRGTVAALESRARRHGATLFVAMLAGIKVLLYRHTAQEDICVGTPVSARTQPELEAQIGPYLNVLPLRDRLTGDDTLAEVIERIKRTTLDALAHQRYPFDLLVQDLRLKRQAGRNPIFEVGFTLQNQLEVQVRDASRHVRMTEIQRDNELFEDTEAETDLWFIARLDEGQLVLQVVYNGARFSPALVDRLLQDLREIVSAAASSPETTVKSIPLAAGDGRAGHKLTIDLGL